MKYMIMMFGDQATIVEVKSPEWIRNMHALMTKIDDELREAGELVEGHRLADPSQARTIRLRDGIPVATDGPFAESKESLAGYWIVDVSEERAIEIASRCVAGTGEPVEVREVMDAPPEHLSDL
ncbi:MAG TPA: YciI family protein [Jiangellaceae bacterium]|nr:YciI family protein [Jiangellaceae bacterium]